MTHTTLQGAAAQDSAAGGRSSASGKRSPHFYEQVHTFRDEFMRRALRWYPRSREDAEDLVQDTLYTACRFAHTFQEGTNLRAWLYRILETTAINRYRKQARTPVLIPFDKEVEGQHEGDMLDLGCEQIGASVEDLVLRSELDGELVRALALLHEEWRAAFVLSVVYELTYQEIAALQHIPLGTVMSRIARSRRKLREALTSFGEEEGYLRAA